MALATPARHESMKGPAERRKRSEKQHEKRTENDSEEKRQRERDIEGQREKGGKGRAETCTTNEAKLRDKSRRKAQ